jgi:hypothetical protein
VQWYDKASNRRQPLEYCSHYAFSLQTQKPHSQTAATAIQVAQNHFNSTSEKDLRKDDNGDQQSLAPIEADPFDSSTL